LIIKTPDEIAKSNEKVIEDSFLPIIALVVFIGLIVGAVVMGLTIYSATLEKIREYGVMKAIGVTNNKLFRIVFQQALIISVFGFIAGIILFYLTKLITFFAVPTVNFDIGLSIYFFIFGLTILISILSSSIPILRISKIDPASVFRA
jgi:putative ABC transport system permease protein